MHCADDILKHYVTALMGDALSLVKGPQFSNDHNIKPITGHSSLFLWEISYKMLKRLIRIFHDDYFFFFHR